MEHVSQSMKAPCKHRTGQKTKHVYTRTSPIYKFINIISKSAFVMKTNAVRDKT
jgi:hypothetical protein